MPESLKDQKSKIIFYSLPTIIIFLASAFLFLTPYQKHVFVNIPLHSAIEAAGAAVAMILSVLLVSEQNKGPRDVFKVVLSSALISMGVLDFFHSFVEPGQNFVWLHSMATFCGGVLFSLVWVPQRFVLNSISVPISIFIMSCLLAIFSVVFPETIPLMLEDSTFTPTAKILNLIGGVGFFFGSAWFFTGYYTSKKQDFLLFANHCLLFAVSAVIFDLSTIWDIEWWLWHGTRLLAYLVALSLIFRIYKKVERQKNKLLSELQEALENIKILKGFLPICASCKKIKDNDGNWNQIESYIKERSEAEFTHSICPDCAHELYPEIDLYKKKE